MASSNTRLREFVAVISLQNVPVDEIKRDYFPRIQDFVRDCNADCYAYILHDRDVRDDGSAKTPHIHLLCSFPSCKRGTRLTTWINKLADALHVWNTAISLEPLSSFDGSFQYLIHKNDPEKYQYPKEEIVSSFSRAEVDTILLREVKSFTFDYLVDCCWKANSLRALISLIGFKTYVGYRNVVRDVWFDIEAEKCEKRGTYYVDE